MARSLARSRQGQGWQLDDEHADARGRRALLHAERGHLQTGRAARRPVPERRPEAAYIVDSVVAHCEDAFPLCYQVRARRGLGLGLGLARVRVGVGVGNLT